MNTKNIKLRVTFELLNSGESHFSSEESGIIYYIGFCCFITTFILIQSIKLIRKDYKKNEEIDSALVWLLVTISIEVLQNYFNFIHLISYSNNGYGIAGF